MDKDNTKALEELKKDYSELQKKYELPNFNELNENFNIERISEMNTDILVREIRKFMADKFSNYLRFIETLLNPVNAPIFVFSIIRSINSEEKDKLQEIYKKLAKIEIRAIKNDLKFSTDMEVKFIKEFYEAWQEIKKEIFEVIEFIEENWNKKSEFNGKSYFG